MICLDPNFLIGGVTAGRPESARLRRLLQAGESLCTAAPAWYEFLCGPVSQRQVQVMAAFLDSRILPFDDRTA